MKNRTKGDGYQATGSGTRNTEQRGRGRRRELRDMDLKKQESELGKVTELRESG
jgi:hypothetical protein